MKDGLRFRVPGPWFFYTGIIFIFLFTSCVEKKPAVPGNVLSQDKMVKVMADIQMAEAAVTIKGLPLDSSKKYLDEYYSAVFSIHGIDRKKFEESFRFYESNPELLNEIYDAVLTELSRRQGEEANK